jgi:hypothetical protein
LGACNPVRAMVHICHKEEKFYQALVNMLILRRTLRRKRDTFIVLRILRLLHLGACREFSDHVLAGQPEGRASLGDLKRAVAILISSGPDWTERTKRLAARAPNLDIFSQSFVLRDEAGWQITNAGIAFLAAIETPISATADIERLPEAGLMPKPIRPSPQIRQIGRRKPRRGVPQRRRPPSAA